MRRPRFYIDGPIPERGILQLPGPAVRHITTVLRLKTGAAITVFNGRGGEYPGQLLSAQKHQAQLRILGHNDIEREIAWPLCLALCISKGAKMDFSVQKATELGVTRTQPLISARGIVRLDARRAARRLEHWRDIVVSASEQCGRNRLNEIAPVLALDDWLAAGREPGLKLLLSPAADLPLAQCPAPDATGICLLIGPEGGFTEMELGAARARGFQSVSCGARILRAETAAIAGPAAVLALWNES